MPSSPSRSGSWIGCTIRSSGSSGSSAPEKRSAPCSSSSQSAQRQFHGLASGFFTEAMHWYEKAMASSPAGNDDAILRWNACVRFLEQNPQLGIDTAEAAGESGFPDGAPAR